MVEPGGVGLGDAPSPAYAQYSNPQGTMWNQPAGSMEQGLKATI